MLGQFETLSQVISWLLSAAPSNKNLKNGDITSRQLVWISNSLWKEKKISQ